MLIEWLWTIITGVGLAIIVRNMVEAKRRVNAVKRSDADPKDKIGLLSVAYGNLLRQLGLMMAVGFNFSAGALILAVTSSPLRSDVAVALLMASAFTMTILSAVEAIRDE